jgi:hypothetical protein
MGLSRPLPQALGCPEPSDQRPSAGLLQPTGGRWPHYCNDSRLTEGLVAEKSSREAGWRSLKSSPQRDRVGQRADAFDGDRDALPGVQWADAGGSAGEDHVTG